MSQLPPVPDEIQIEVEHDFGGTTYRLAPTRERTYYLITFPVFLILHCFFLLFFISLSLRFLRLLIQAPDILYLLFLAGSIAGTLWILFNMYVQMRPQHPEIITLKEKAFCLDSGSSSFKRLYSRYFKLQHPHPYGLLGGYFRNRIHIEIDRQNLGEIYRLPHRKAKLLYLNYDGKHIEIGERLNDTERDWLEERIREWRQT